MRPCLIQMGVWSAAGQWVSGDLSPYSRQNSLSGASDRAVYLTGDVPVSQPKLDAPGIVPSFYERTTQASRNWWGWTGKPSLAARPSLVTSWRTFESVMGPPRSEVNTKGEQV